MRKLSKTLLSLLLIAAMLASFVVLPAAAEEPAAEQPTEAVQAAETQAADDTSYRYNIVHVDAGRKYFSPTSIKAIIDNAAEAGFNQVELYLSDNQGFRFALDDMTVTTSTGNTYDLSAALGDGYTASDGKCPDGSDKYLTQSEMTDIIAYARSKNVEIVPCVNAPGHMGAILEEFSDFRYTSGWQTSKSSILEMLRLWRLLLQLRTSTPSTLPRRAANTTTSAQMNTRMICRPWVLRTWALRCIRSLLSS